MNQVMLRSSQTSQWCYFRGQPASGKCSFSFVPLIRGGGLGLHNTVKNQRRPRVSGLVHQQHSERQADTALKSFGFMDDPGSNLQHRSWPLDQDSKNQEEAANIPLEDGWAQGVRVRVKVVQSSRQKDSLAPPCGDPPVLPSRKLQGGPGTWWRDQILLRPACA